MLHEPTAKQPTEGVLLEYSSMASTKSKIQTAHFDFKNEKTTKWAPISMGCLTAKIHV
jgi:hypothetical protein